MIFYDIFVILMQTLYYSMDCMFFIDTYFIYQGLMIKFKKKNIEPWSEFHSGPACYSVKLWKWSSKFFVQLFGLVCQYFKILIYSIFWRYVFDYWCFDGIVELVVATCWMDFLARQWIQMSVRWFISGLAVWYKTKFGSQNFGYQNW